MFSKLSAASVLALVALSHPTHAFWRMGCSLIQTGRVDPIVAPGQVSGHVHKVAGASTFNVSSDFDSLSAASCTSCSIQADKSAYWTPQLYYQRANGSFQDVRAPGMTVYYLGRGDDRAEIIPFPKGLRMMSGNPKVRSFDSAKKTYLDRRPEADRVSFACLDTDPMPETPSMSRTQCKNGLRAQIHFQSCWNGVDLYKADNSHVAYLSNIDNGVCPPSHPKKFIHLFYEVLYSMDSVVTEEGGRFVFAQGDPTGYGFHGDFLNGWDDSILSRAIKECLDTNKGGISDCPPLMESNDDRHSRNCPPLPSIIQEQVTGVLDRLPGCNDVAPGPDAASNTCPADYQNPSIRQGSGETKGPTSSGSSAPSSTSAAAGSSGTLSAPAPGTTVTGGGGDWVYLGCANEVSGRAVRGASVANDSMTNEMCQSFCLEKGFGLSATEYARECYCGRSLEAGSSVGQSGCEKSCKGNSSSICGGSSRLSVYNSTSFAGPAVVASVGGYTSQGCFTEASSGRALSEAKYSDNSNMTVDSCVSFCLGKGFSHAGVEYAQECYCGNSLASTSKPAAAGECNKLCRGNSKQYCGGSSRLNVYKRD